ncbi:MAG: cell division protein ZapA [Eubacterium sp.]|nr:cell division protein ZapA [Eubacterium sp.]
MAEKTTIKVLIDGKIVTLSGYESEDYLQHVAYYLNTKIAELRSLDGYNRQSQETKATLLALNIADDYFKAKAQVDAMQEDLEDKDQSAYDVKHDLVNMQMENERLRKEIAELRGKKTVEN